MDSNPGNQNLNVSPRRNSNVSRKNSLKQNLNDDYDRVIIKQRATGGPGDNTKSFKEDMAAAQEIKKMLDLRNKYVSEGLTKFAEENEIDASFEEGAGDYSGVCILKKGDRCLTSLPTMAMFQEDLKTLWAFCNSPFNNGFCNKRLKLLGMKYEIHELLNSDVEKEGMINDPADFFSIRKVDNHIHAAALMTAPHLLQYIKQKITEPGQETLKADVLREAGIEDGDIKLLTVDSLRVQADESVFERFDNFNASYNPFGKRFLRDKFLKPEKHCDHHTTENFFREIVMQVIADTRKQKSIHLEPRMSIHGKSEQEWCELAVWFQERVQCEDAEGNRLSDQSLIEFSYIEDKQDVKWMIQSPRPGFADLKRQGKIDSFGHFLKNFFRPLFQATLHPDDEKNKPVSELMLHIAGFDTVGDESHPLDELYAHSVVPPSAWTVAETPNYSYYTYYFWANIQSLNQLRRAKGLNTFSLRPHAGEAGPVHHLATTFLLADSINHGNRLTCNKPLMYLYYLTQIGMAVSPLSNNALYLPIGENPFETYHAIGLNATLSTDDPLQFHSTKEPLMEEYMIASKVFKLSNPDLAEVAARSVRQSGFSHERKKEWLGDNYWRPGADGNDTGKSNIPTCRSAFRYDCLLEEFKLIFKELEDANVEERNRILCVHTLPPMVIEAVQKEMAVSGGEFVLTSPPCASIKLMPVQEDERLPEDGFWNRLSSSFMRGNGAWHQKQGNPSRNTIFSGSDTSAETSAHTKGGDVLRTPAPRTSLKLMPVQEDERPSEDYDPTAQLGSACCSMSLFSCIFPSLSNK